MTAPFRVTFGLAVLVLGVGGAQAQRVVVPPGADSVTTPIAPHYQASGFHRFWFGGAYRDLWTTPIRLPVLHLGTYAGGLRPLKESGSVQTAGLRFRGADGSEYVFRSIDKDNVGIPERWKHGVVEKIAHDLTSNAQPVGFLVAPPILDAAGVLHVTPTMVVMPDDSLLGDFREKFAGRVGEIEIVPAKSKEEVSGFANAAAIIDSDSLRILLDRDPTQHIDAPTFLAARLVDMLLNDWDRHPGQWKWAQLSRNRDAAWEPIPRDRDKVLISISGLIPNLAAMASPDLSLVSFTDNYASIEAMTFNSAFFDRRLLGGMEKPVWDSVARALRLRISDSVIDRALGAMPPEFHYRVAEFARKLRHRRDALPEVATRFYLALATFVNVHGTEAAERATITQVDDNHVEVELQAGRNPPYFRRQFDARETRELRVYLHGGDDTAIVTGNVRRSIPIRIIGGNGNNLLIDSSIVAGQRGTAELQDAGTVTGVTYRNQAGLDTLWDRRPLIHLPGVPRAPGHDFGASLAPMPGLSLNHDYGIVPRVDLAKRWYGFGHYPYASSLMFDARYSLKLTRYQIGLLADKRFEFSPVHFTTLAQISQLELINFHGFGNTSPQADTNYYIARQNQWLLRPAIAIALSRDADLSIGAVIQRSVTDTTRGHFVSDNQPYGFGPNGVFSEVGLQLGFHLDTRDQARHARNGNVVNLTATYFPATWDVTHSFETIEGLVAQYVTLPIPTHPFVALRAGGRRVFGDFPFQESAFLGGNSTIRTRYPQSFAGDALVFATGEIRIPVVSFKLLLPLNAGLLATEDLGRVYVHGDSPGGWHYAFGAGFWVGFHELTADIRLMRSEDGRPTLIGFQLAHPIGLRP